MISIGVEVVGVVVLVIEVLLVGGVGVEVGIGWGDR